MECPEIRISLQPSRSLAGVLCALYLLAIVSVVNSTLPAAATWTVVALLVLDLARNLWVHVLARRERSCLLRARDGDWWHERRDVCQPVVVDGASVLIGPVVVLVLRGPGRRRTHLLTRDTFTATDWRRLRVALRLGADKSQPGVRIVSSASGARSG